MSDGVNGYLVPPKSAEELARVITNVLGEPESLLNMREAGLSYASVHLTWPNIVKRVVQEVYQPIVEGFDAADVAHDISRNHSPESGLSMADLSLQIDPSCLDDSYWMLVAIFLLRSSRQSSQSPRSLIYTRSFLLRRTASFQPGPCICRPLTTFLTEWAAQPVGRSTLSTPAAIGCESSCSWLRR